MGDLTPYGPGKFQYLVDAWAYELSLAGCDDEAGEAQYGSGWHGLFRGGLKLDPPFGDLVPQWAEKLSEADQAFIRKHQGGLILREDSQGFVEGHWFEKASECEESWGHILRIAEEEEEGRDDE